MKTFIKLIAVLVSLGAIGAACVFALIIYISFDLPDIKSLDDYKPSVPSRILSSDNVVLLEVGKEDRDVVPISEVPKSVISAFIAAEDDNFYNHSGIDYKGILRATLINLKAGRVVQGASTITQQVAKSLLLTSERTFSRKIKDLLLARKIEEKLTKDEILFLYLNQVYLGGGYYGVKAAFKGYFDKDLKDATVAECALIAGLLVAPGRYSPYINPKFAKKRQRYVLSRLFKTKIITQEEYDLSLAENIKLHQRKFTPMKGGYFTDWIRQRVIEKIGKEEFLNGGYEILTTLDWQLQEKAQNEIKDGVIAIDKRQGFKGPKGKVEDINEFILKNREKVYKDSSDFFIFNADGSVSHEFNIADDNYEELYQTNKAKLEAKPSWYTRSFEPGVIAEDNISKLLDTDKNYDAVVVKVNNSQRIIYVRFAGGLVGAIPYEYFRWAHERNVTEKRNYWSYVTRPSTIVSVGDIIEVKVIRKPSYIWNFIHSDFKNNTKNKDLLSAIKSEKYYILSLEQEPEAQAALVSISPSSGRVLSMVGGYDFSKSQFNRAIQSNRQPGSAFKPLLYAAGLENGYNPASVLLDSPSALGSSDENLNWKPQNYDGKFKGEMTFRRSLETSRNIPTIKMVQDVGVKNVNDFIHRLNPKLDLPNDLSMSLGSFGINLLDLVKMYGVFPNKGKLVKVKSIISIKNQEGVEVSLADEPNDEETKEASEDEKEDEIVQVSEDETEDTKPKNPFLKNLNERQVYDKRLAYLMNNLLKGVIQNGTGKGAKSISSVIGGKTGTTNNYVDAWFLGYSANIVTGVWTGLDNNNTMGFGETGAKSALPIWKAYMDFGLKRLGEYDFSIPSGIVNMTINRESGKLANPGERNTFVESFVVGHGPNEQSIEDTNSEEGDSSTFSIDDDFYSNQ